MSTFVAKDGTQLYFKDWGSGKPVLFSHGWPLDADMWDSQMEFLASRGYRAIAFDRRGFGLDVLGAVQDDEVACGNSPGAGGCVHVTGQPAAAEFIADKAVEIALGFAQADHRQGGHPDDDRHQNREGNRQLAGE